jgi:glycosyltransferase involved in cell wall biosynthesis
VFIEAMSYGLPVLATRVGAIPDFVTPGENGYLVTPGDVDTLAERLIALLGNPDLLRDFGNHSRQLVKERYNWESVAEKIRHRIMTDMGEAPIENSEFSQNYSAR